MPEQLRTVNRILVYIDGSDTSITAAEYAIVTAKLHAAPLWAAYVVDTKVLDDLMRVRIFIKAEAADYEYDLEEDGKRYLNHVRQLGRAKGVEITPILLKGEPAHEISKQLEALGIDLLVVNAIEEFTSRRETFLDPKEQMLRRAKCQILVVKDEERASALYEALE
ncbi:MAG: universal stress protein [Verrucomicrobia bacterium]|nr:universal stress protein [Verrucomicrobiota bacterium]